MHSKHIFQEKNDAMVVGLEFFLNIFTFKFFNTYTFLSGRIFPVDYKYVDIFFRYDVI